MLATVVLLIFALSGQPPSVSRGVAVSGVVQDQTGAVLQGAEVVLRAADSPTIQSIVCDAGGLFRFDQVAPGTYDVSSAFPGFKTNVSHLRVTARAPGPLTIVMAIEGLTQEVSVSSGGAQTSAQANANLDTISIDANALDDLPILDQDVVASMSRFLDSSTIGTGGTTIVVDGVEVNALSASASAVQQIKINQDPYSAEFARPGRGRIEIVTKPDGKDYSGTLNLRFRDSAFYARNAFAATKPPQQRRIFEPYSFIQQAGDGQVRFLEKVLGAFVQDDIRLRSNLSLNLGLRYDWQSYFHDENNFAPRASFAYSPGQNGRTVLRGGAQLRSVTRVRASRFQPAAPARDVRHHPDSQNHEPGPVCQPRDRAPLFTDEGGWTASTRERRALRFSGKPSHRRRPVAFSSRFASGIR
ncbi:MAG TPA: TonB-dependent receptor [Vicinamibacterales bacterium]